MKDDIPPRRTVYVIGTADTKGIELAYVRDCVVAAGVDAILVDVGTSGETPRTSVDVTAKTVAEHHPDGAAAVFSDDRGAAVTAMGVALQRHLAQADDVDGVIGIGGSGGTALITPAMQDLPVGVPKVMVSTVASGDVSAYVGPADIAMMYSVTDVAGLNRVSRVVLANAAHAVAGMVAFSAPEAEAEAEADHPVVGLTMFGVTTDAVTQVVDLLGANVESLVFHATGTGGQSLEKLVASGLVPAVIDVTTTEVADLMMGGVFSAGESRMDVYAEQPIPYIGSCGALDMVNFGAPDTVPEAYADRLFHEHNAQVTLMRTTPQENDRMGAWIAAKLNACAGPVRFFLPEGGVSALDAPGQAFHDPEADAALFSALERDVEITSDHQLIRVPHHINDPEMAELLVSTYRELTEEDDT